MAWYIFKKYETQLEMIKISLEIWKNSLKNLEKVK